MKNIALAVTIAASLVAPLGALADATPAGPPPGGPPGFGAFAQVREQVDKARSQARLTMLNALSSQHRNLLAQVVGGLAVAQTPDVAAAAKTLDGSLSAGESKAIADASNALDQQIQQIIQANRPPDGGPPGMQMRQVPGSDDTARNDPGMILLRTVLPAIGRNMMFRAGGPPPGS